MLMGCILACAPTIYAMPSQPIHHGFNAQNAHYLNYSMSVEYSGHETEFDQDTEKFRLDGVALGLSSSPYQSGWYTKFEILANQESDSNYYEFVLGSQLNLINYYGFYALAQLGFGYSWFSSEYLSNTVNFMTLPIGLEMGLSILPELSVYGGVGYKWVWDITSKARCNDGSLTNFTDSGNCNWNGGVDYFRDSVGDHAGMTYKAGLRYNF